MWMAPLNASSSSFHVEGGVTIDTWPAASVKMRWGSSGDRPKAGAAVILERGLTVPQRGSAQGQGGGEGAGQHLALTGRAAGAELGREALLLWPPLAHSTQSAELSFSKQLPGQFSLLPPPWPAFLTDPTWFTPGPEGRVLSPAATSELPPPPNP